MSSAGKTAVVEESLFVSRGFAAEDIVAVREATEPADDLGVLCGRLLALFVVGPAKQRDAMLLVAEVLGMHQRHIEEFEQVRIDPASGAPAKFEARKTSDDLPNSVVFDYDASGFGTDSVYIQQSWDASRRERVSAAGKQHTSLYYYPGYFDAKLIVNGQVQKHSPVFIETKGWKGIVATRPVPVYLTAAEITAPGSLGIKAATLRRKTGSPVFTNTWVDFLNIRAFDGLDAAHFTMEAVLRNTSTVEQSLCRKIRITVVGKERAIIIPLAAKGCIADLQLLTGDRMISGKDQDLSAFGCDFRTFQRVSCTVENGHLQIFLNGALILNTPQEHTIGDIVGLNLAFEGIGEIKSISLGAGGSAKPVYYEKFNH